MNKAQISLGPLLLSVLHGLESLEKASKEVCCCPEGAELWHHRYEDSWDRENSGRISWPVEQPHGRLSIENGWSVVAENAGWLLRKVGH